jgi:glycosyltransferase involved in cell wall biosynthesis
VTGNGTRRIGCNLLWLSPGRVGGSEEYCVRLLTAFADRSSRHPDLDVRLLVNRRFAEVYPELTGRLPTDVAPVDGRRRAGRVVAEHTWLPATCRKRRIHVVHHLGGTVPFAGGTDALVLVHDLQPWAMPENFTPLKRRYLEATVPRSVRRAAAVTTLSAWVARDVSDRLGVPLDKMVVIPPGADSPGPSTEQAVVPVLERHQLVDRRFFLYPAITYPHKNHVTLLRAFARVASQHRDATLVLTGGDAGNEAVVRRTIDELDLGSQVRRLGRVAESDLDAMYRRATALTFPSRYEGFGMPVLEAMSRTCPVIASRACALPEVVGDGGMLVGADDVAGWAGAMEGLLSSAPDRSRWADAAGARAGAFSWETAVDTLAELYRHGPLTPGPPAP